MTNIQPTQEGLIPFHPPRAPSECSTYYKVFGDLDSGSSVPLIMVHGGPGGGHDYLLPYADLWPLYGIPVIFYDQVGGGKSSHLHELDGDKTFWTVELFVAELRNLIRHFKLDEATGRGYHLLGQSFGGKTSAVLASQQPEGLRRLILASVSASQDTVQEGYKLRAKTMSQEDQRAIHEAVATGNFQSEGYKTAMDHFYRTFACRSDPYPAPQMAPAFKTLGESTTWKTMMGESLFDPSKGVLANHSLIPMLHKIQVPTLVFNGEFDTAHDVCTAPFFEEIPRVRWYTFADAGHFLHVENDQKRDKCLKLVGEFLKEDRSGSRP